MAPKKFVPSKNPISRRGSSSSSSPSVPDSIMFCDEKSQKYFYENFIDWAIHSKCQVLLSYFPDIPLLDAFSSRCCTSLCEIPKRCSDVLMQEFYSNMHAINTSMPKFTTIFQGTCIVVTPKLISNVLRIRRVENPNYPSHIRLHSISRDEMASLFCEKAMMWEKL